MHVIYLREEDSNPEKQDISKRKEFVKEIPSTSVHDKCLDCSATNCNIDSEESIEEEESNHEESYACDFCNKSFCDESELQKHYPVHIDIKSFSCDVCQNTFSQESAYLAHTCYVSKPTIVCDVCGKNFRSEKSFKKHYTFHTRDRPYKCKICDKSFIREYNLNQHYAFNKCKIFTCFVCGISFSEVNHLRDHEKTHSEVHNSGDETVHNPAKPHVCDVCGKCFRIKHLLKIHYPIHTGERAFACSDCDMRFTAERTLHLHFRRHHIGGVRPFICDVCDKAFLFKRELKAHYYKHTGGRPFQCTICGTGFCHNKSLTRHVRLGKCHIKRRKASERNGIMIYPARGYKRKQENESSVEDESLDADMMDDSSSASDLDYIKKELVDESYIGEVCNEQFKQEDLQEHSTVHMPEFKTVSDRKSYHCKMCGKIFRLRISLQKHTCNFVSMPCSACGKNFKSESELKKHKCPKVIPKVYSCSMCNKSFLNEIKFNEHYCPQTDDRPFECKVCGRAFRFEDSLERHRLIHEGVNLASLWESYVLDRKASVQKHSLEPENASVEAQNEEIYVAKKLDS